MIINLDLKNIDKIKAKYKEAKLDKIIENPLFTLLSDQPAKFRLNFYGNQVYLEFGPVNPIKNSDFWKEVELKIKGYLGTYVKD
jgi:hypothetical protein